MSYIKPEVKKYEMELENKKTASNINSCNGGHCVRVQWEGDH